VHRTLRLLLAAALLAGAPVRAGEPSPAPWKPPPRFAAIWLQGGVFVPSGLGGARVREEVALGLSLRPLPFASLLAEGGWITRDLPWAGGPGRSSLVSRGATLGLKLHRQLGSLEPSLLGGVSAWTTGLAVPVDLASSAGARSESARTTGLVLGVGLDWLFSETMALALDWRWHRARGNFPELGGGRLDLSGQAAGLALRLYWP